MKKYLAWAAAALLTAAPANAATLLIDSDGILTGATGVDVGGTFYDVSFLDGTCAAVFSGCDSAADIAFPNDTSGNIAAQSLLDQVFLGLYDGNPALTRGCGSGILCAALIPTSVVSNQSQGWSAVNGSNDLSDTLFYFATGNTFDSTGESTYTWARFTLSNATGAVPEPSTWAMMLMGFAAMGVALRHRRKLANIAQFA